MRPPAALRVVVATLAGSCAVACDTVRGRVAPLLAGLDLRLAVGAAAAWCAVLGVQERSAGAAFAAGVAAAVAGVGCLVLLRRHGSWAAEAALMLFCTALVLVPFAGRMAHARGSLLFALARSRTPVTIRLTLSGDPQLLTAKGVAGTARVAVPASAAAVLRNGHDVPVDGDVLVLAPQVGWADLLPGQPLRVDGTLQPSLDPAALSVTLFVRGLPTLDGSPPWWQRAAGRVRSSLRSAARTLPDQERGLLPGLIDGDTSGLDPVLAARFRTAGLTHLVAVSGTNCSIVIGAVLLALRRLRVRPQVAAAVGALVLVAFVVVARPSPSVLRAAAMASIALVALATGRPRAALPSLSAGVLALLVWDPTLASDVGFAMSVAATAALLVIAPSWASALGARGVPVGIAEAVAVAAAAHLVTAPMIAAISGQVSLVAVAANVLAEPVVAVATVAGFLAALVAPVWLGAGQACAWVAGWPCRWLVWVADFFGGLQGATLPWPGGSTGAMTLFAALAVLGVLLSLRQARPLLAVAALVALVVQFPVRSAVTSWPPPGWIFVACDVGQGDGLVLNAGGGAGVVVDTGPDPVPEDRCLRELDISALPLIVLTHYHLDHVGGLAGAMRGRSVGRIVAGPLLSPESGVVSVDRLAGSRGLRVTTPAVGTSFHVGAVQLDVLGPAAPFHDTHSDPNNSSLVMRATVRGIRILLSGDAEIDAQRALLDAHVDLRADVLKVAHHGSAYFDPDYVNAVHARVAVISVGAHNDYGHPSPLALQALALAGMQVERTDRDGDVAITVTGGQLGVVTHGVIAATSEADARMPVCQLARSPPTTCPARCPPLSCSSATRSFWSTARSARSPPRSGGPTRRLSSQNWPALPSKAPSSTRC